MIVREGAALCGKILRGEHRGGLGGERVEQFWDERRRLSVMDT
jgi:hypothetical protein